MDHKLYGFYRSNILLDDRNFQIPVKKPSLSARIWKRTKENLGLEFLRDWSIHGVKYIGQPQRLIIERTFWALTVIVCMGAAACINYAVIAKYFNSPMLIAFQSSKTSISQIPFPAVTICNVNNFKKSRLEEAFRTLKNTDNDTEAEIAAFIISEMHHVCAASPGLNAKLNFSLDQTSVNIDDTTLTKFLSSFWQKRTKDPLPMKKYALEHIYRAVQSCDEMIPLCMWDDEKFKCDEYFRFVTTDFGICCTFNMMPGSVLLKMNKSDLLAKMETARIPAEELKVWEAFNLDASLSEHHTRDQERYPRHQSKAGQTSGLSVMLNPGIDEYHCAGHDSYGYRIAVHPPTEFPQVFDFGLAVGTNVEMLMDIQAELVVAESDVKGLSPAKRKCYFLNETSLDNYQLYSSTNCYDDCMSRVTIKRCGCAMFDMHLSSYDTVKPCIKENLTCANEFRRNVSTFGQKHYCKQCMPTCNRIMYETQTSSLPLRQDVWQHANSAETKDWSNKNVSLVHVYFGSDSVYTRVRKRFVTFSELFANVGGVLGLFVGFSVISCVEPFYYLVRKWVMCKEECDATQLN